ncbi:MAG TPA: energy transducer TonB [Candidatus Didemnitutus sp.]|nr:energy transducer TonB [Candidatus Didemnitutus sp.]
MAAATAVASSESDVEMAARFGLVRYVAPQYPIMALDRGILDGLVTVAVAWTDAGIPSDVVVLHTSESTFASPARDAVLEWRRAPTPGVSEVVRYELRFARSGVVVSRNHTLGSRFAEASAEKKEPYRVPLAGDLDRPLKPIAQPMPEFPAEAKGRFDQATVVVDFYVDEKGRVRAPIVRESTAPEFSREALEALQQWRYETPRKDGQPAVMSESWAFNFHRST